MKRTAVINVVGLAKGLIHQNNTPSIFRFAQAGKLALINPAFPALTCTAQSNYLTGVLPRQHGIVANGWYDRDLNEPLFWKQSNRLVTARKIWEEIRKIYPGFKCANLFWWFNMYSSVDYSITPRPIYLANGRKIPDIYTEPFSIKNQIETDIGKFPFPTFWGPFAGVDSKTGRADAASRWIAQAAMWIEEKYHPDLALVYLPHLDYNLQRYGTNEDLIKDDLMRIDSIVGELIEFYRQRQIQVILVSEYGISDVKAPIFLNWLFREKGWLRIKDELGRERLDCGASRAFAIVDHQIAHIYVNDKSLLNQVKDCLENCPGVAAVLDENKKREFGVDHPRAGDFVAIAQPDHWFAYYYWFDDKQAPDFATTVDIHRKPGYDPVELFLQNSPFIKAKLAFRILQSRLGFRTLFDIIPLDATLVRGSHGAPPMSEEHYPVLIAESPSLIDGQRIESTAVYSIIERAATGSD